MTTGANRASGVSSHALGSALSVVVTPRAGKSSIEQRADGAIQVRVAAPPVDGAANAALLRFLAGALDVPRSLLKISSGETSRRKRIVIAGVSPNDLESRLQAALGKKR